MDGIEVTRVNSALNVTELSDEDFQVMVSVLEMADRASRDQDRARTVRNCRAIVAMMMMRFFAERGIYVAYDGIQDMYHYSTEDGGN